MLDFLCGIHFEAASPYVIKEYDFNNTSWKSEVSFERKTGNRVDGRRFMQKFNHPSKRNQLRTGN